MEGSARLQGELADTPERAIITLHYGGPASRVPSTMEHGQGTKPRSTLLKDWIRQTTSLAGVATLCALKLENFRGNRLGSVTTSSIARRLTTSRLETLMLDDKQFTDADMFTLARAFARTAEVVNVSMQHNAFMEDGKAALRAAAASASASGRTIGLSR